MVILFKGTDVSDNYAPEALAMCAGLSATKFLKKTLVIQLTSKRPVQQLLIGKRLKDQRINGQMYLFEDTGLDSLTRRAEITSLNVTHFDNACIPCLSSENLFDILEESKKIDSDVIREFTENPNLFSIIIKAAKNIYDNIFVLVDANATEMIDALLPFIDKTVTCIPQGNKEEITAKSTEKHCFLVTDFDYKSTYSVRTMIKTYFAKKMYIMSYNVELKDSSRNQDMINFVLHNSNPDKSNYNYRVISDLTKFVEQLLEYEEKEEKEYLCDYNRFTRRFNTAVILDGSRCEIEETPKKLFNKSKKNVHMTDNEYAQGELVRKEA